MNPPMQIACPHCGQTISLTEALANDLRHRLQQEYDQRLSTRLNELRNELARSYEAERTQWETRLAENAAALAKAQADRLALEHQAQRLAEREQQLSTEIARRLEAAKQTWMTTELAQLRAEIRQQEAQQVATQVSMLQQELERHRAALLEAERQELVLRQRTRDIEERERRMALDMERRLDQERHAWLTQAREQLAQEFQLQLSEKDHQLETMRRQIETLRHQANQGSQQLQGEVLEVHLEESLRQTFPQDRIEPVPKGVRGADVIQHIQTVRGDRAGTILWETKRTKQWSNGWLEKLRNDQRLVTADCALLVTNVLPSTIKHFGFLEGVWIASHEMAIPVATALRITLLQLADLRQAEVGKHEKTERVYDYLTGLQFRQRIEAIVEAFHGLHTDLAHEKQAMQRIWASREKQLQRALEAMASMHGEIRGIIGATLPEVHRLSLETIALPHASPPLPPATDPSPPSPSS